MKFRNQISLSFLVGILIPFGILVLLTTINFQNSFKKYLEYEQNIKFQSIEQMVSSIMNTTYPTEQKQALLNNYVSNEQLQIEIFDNDNNKLLDINAMTPSTLGVNKEIITKRYPLKNQNQVIGTIQFSFIDSNYNDVMTLVFNRTMLSFLILSIMIALVAAFIMNYIFAHHLSKPISLLSNATKQIKDGKFDNLSIPASDTYEIQTLSNDIKFLANTLQQQKEIRENYAQDISHELRTPLTNLQLHVEALKDEIIEPNEENFDAMLSELTRLNHIVTDLKESFSDNISEQLHYSRFEISNLLMEIYLAIYPSFIKKEVELVHDLEDSVIILTDRDKLAQIIQNLLTNALKACDKGDRVTLSLSHKNNKLLISIIDTGIGMSEESLDKIFDRFYRIDNARNTKVGGSGLGLSIVKNYTHQLGGKIFVHSKKDIGTEFILEFPDEIMDVSELAEKI